MSSRASRNYFMAKVVRNFENIDIKVIRSGIIFLDLFNFCRRFFSAFQIKLIEKTTQNVVNLCIPAASEQNQGCVFLKQLTRTREAPNSHFRIFIQIQNLYFAFTFQEILPRILPPNSQTGHFLLCLTKFLDNRK